MRVVVTGAAGFIGGRVARTLAAAGCEVLAVDAPQRSMAPGTAWRNWSTLAERAGVTPFETDLAVDDLAKLAEADAIVHLAGRPGVRSSWGGGAAITERDNVTATRRLLAACTETGRRPAVVVASSSSVYGSAGPRPQHEDDELAPSSPYAVSKVAVERLTTSAAEAGLPAVTLRYFSVYGPRQRPDMAFHRFTEAALHGRPLPLFGDGRQRRAFTHVDDVAAATVSAMRALHDGELQAGTTINIGHESAVELRTAIDLLAGLLDVRPEFEVRPPQAGDVRATRPDTARATRLLGWTARTGLAEGLADQLRWHRRSHMSSHRPSHRPSDQRGPGRRADGEHPAPAGPLAAGLDAWHTSIRPAAEPGSIRW